MIFMQAKLNVKCVCTSCNWTKVGFVCANIYNQGKSFNFFQFNNQLRTPILPSLNNLHRNKNTISYISNWMALCSFSRSINNCCLSTDNEAGSLKRHLIFMMLPCNQISINCFWTRRKLRKEEDFFFVCIRWGEKSSLLNHLPNIVQIKQFKVCRFMLRV